MTTPKFMQGKGDFHTTLKNRVNSYFVEKHRPMTGNFALLFKAILLCLGYILIYIHLLFFTPAVWIAIPMILGIISPPFSTNTSSPSRMSNLSI